MFHPTAYLWADPQVCLAHCHYGTLTVSWAQEWVRCPQCPYSPGFSISAALNPSQWIISGASFGSSSRCSSDWLQYLTRPFFFSADWLIADWLLYGPINQYLLKLPSSYFPHGGQLPFFKNSFAVGPTMVVKSRNWPRSWHSIQPYFFPVDTFRFLPKLSEASSLCFPFPTEMQSSLLFFKK